MSNATGGYQPPSTGSTTGDPFSSTDPLGTGGSGEGSTTGLAKEQAGQVGQTAKEATTQVASTAADQAKNVAGETKRQAQDLISQAGTQVQEQASAQKDKASGGLRTVADELRSLSRGEGSQNEMITGLTQQFADKAQEVADWLEQRDPSSLLDEARSLARRKPGTFLIGAALAGVLAGRMTKGVISAQSDNNDTDTWASATTTSTPYGESTFADGTDAFATSESAYATEAPSLTMPASTVVVGQEHATAGSEFGTGSGSGYGEGQR